MPPSQVIVLAMPVFLALIGLEWWWGRRRGRDTYRLNDALGSLALGVISQVLPQLLRFTVYTAVWSQAALFALPADAWWVWLLAALGYDFCYYWLHRAGHRVAIFWAAHAVHHQSEEYNLSTALRQTGSGWLLGWLAYLPLAVLGVPPLVFLTVGLVDLLYQFWVHTRQIGRLGWFDRWFCSPSNHRVHHAVNDRYLDRNYGGILMVWDRLFGTFIEEDDAEPIVYGTRTPLASWDPWHANTVVYAERWRLMRHARGWREHLAVWLAPPDWRPAAAPPAAPFVLQRQAYDPAWSRGRQGLALACFAALLAGMAAWLWQAHALSALPLWGGAAALLLGSWLVGWSCTPSSSGAGPAAEPAQPSNRSPAR